MKKTIIIALILTALLAAVLTGCGNMTLLDTTYTFDRAIICLPNGEIIESEIESWTDFDGEQLQITIDGVTYLVSSINAVLIAE